MLNRRIPGAVGTRAARTFVAASTQYLTANTGFGLGANDPCYIVVWAKRDTTGFITVAYLGSPTSGADSRRIFTTTTDAINAWCQDAGGTNTSVASAGGSFTTSSGWTSIIAEFASASSRRIIVNGVASTSTATRTLTAAPTAFQIGTLSLSSQPFSGGVAHAAIFAGTASDALINAHRRGVHPTQLPGQLLECWDLDRMGPIIGLVRGTVLSPTNGGNLTVGPPIQGPPVLSPLPLLENAGGTGYTLSADSGTVTATGTDARPLYQRVVSAASEAVTATGTAARLLYLRVLAALSAAIALTGTSARTLWQRVVSAASAAWTITGTAAATLWHRVIRAETATVDMTGTAATLSYSGDTGPTMDERRKTFLLMGIYK